MSFLIGQNRPMNIDSIISANLNALMEMHPELGSQVLLSKKTGVATSTVGRIRRGEVSPTAESLEAIGKAFGIHPGELMDIHLAARIRMSSEIIIRLERITQKVRSGKLDDRQLKVIEATLELD